MGVDYFIMKQLALTTEARLVVAPDADVNGLSVSDIFHLNWLECVKVIRVEIFS